MKKNVIQKIAVVIFGLVAALVLLELGIRIGGFIFSSVQERRNITSMKQKGAYRIMCIGESTTAFGGRSSWPAQLENILNARAAGMKFSVINKGVAGIDTNFLMKNLERNLDKYNPRMVIAMMGLNDADMAAIHTDNSIKTLQFVRMLPRSIAEGVRKTEIYKHAMMFKEIVNKNPSDGDAFIRLAWQYQNLRNYADALKSFEKAIEVSPDNDRYYFELGVAYKAQAEYVGSEESFKKALSLNPNNAQARFELGLCYKLQGKYEDAEKSLNMAVALNPRDSAANFVLGRCYIEQGDYAGAEKIWEKAIEQNPADYVSYVELGRCCMEQGKYGKAVAVLKKGIEFNPQNNPLYFELGRCYRKQSEYGMAEAALEKSIKLDPFNPNNDKTYFELAHCYTDLKKYDKAEAVLKDYTGHHPKNDSAYDELAALYETVGKRDAALAARRKADEIRMGNWTMMIRRNYPELKRILDKRGIKLVAVQYPLRSVEPLKKILEQYKDVIIVDNEKLFKDALSKGNYDEYFLDTWFGDFGHGTPKGNRLLAENIANVLLKESFGVTTSTGAVSSENK